MKIKEDKKDYIPKHIWLKLGADGLCKNCFKDLLTFLNQ